MVSLFVVSFLNQIQFLFFRRLNEEMSELIYGRITKDGVSESKVIADLRVMRTLLISTIVIIIKNISSRLLMAFTIIGVDLLL